MSTEWIRDVVISSVHSFPAMSGAAPKVLTLLDDPNTNASDIEEVLRYDPGLTANLLKLANSAYFGYPGGIGSVGQAVTRIGWKRMYQLVVAATVQGLMHGPVKGYDLPSEEMWRHSLAASVAAEVLAREYQISAPDETFTAALLHDVGKLVLARYVEPNAELLDLAVSRGISFDAAEREVLGTDHAEVGGWILEHWAFPPVLVDAVRWHHQPDAAERQSLVTDVVHAADMFCLLLNIGAGRDGMQYSPSLGVAARLGIRPEGLKSAAERIFEGVHELSAALG